jgi:hypothetical protein
MTHFAACTRFRFAIEMHMRGIFRSETAPLGNLIAQ